MSNASEDWENIKTLFSQAMELPAGERESFVEKQAYNDTVKKEVILLLQSAENTDPAFENLVANASMQSNQVVQADMLIQQYRIVRHIGQGGMGEVYLAERADKQFEKQVALKLISSHKPSAELVERFRFERQVLASLEHPNIARLLDGGETENGVPFLVMEYVDGIAIDKYCDQQALSTRKRIKLFMEVCQAIQYAHQNLIVHRDIKASNILINLQGTVKLLDFGIAKAIEDKDLSLTQTAARIMSPLHASPEQVRGQKITVSSDVYSLGVLLYQLLSGFHPIAEQSTQPGQIERAICEDYPSKPSNRLSKLNQTQDLDTISKHRAANPNDLVKQLGGDLDNIVMKTLNKEPERRYATVQELIDDLHRYLHNRPVLARPSSLSYKSYKFFQRNRAASIIAASAVSLIIAISAFSYNSIINERDAAKEAQASAEAVSDFLQDIFSSVNPFIARGETVTAFELLEAGQEKISTSLSQDKKTAMVMHKVLAYSYKGLGDLDRALKQIETSLDIADELNNIDAATLGDIKLIRGLIAQDLSDFDTASKYITEARALIESAYIPPHSAIVEAIHSLAFLEDTLSHHESAIALYQEAIDMNNSLPKDETYEKGFTETRLTDVLRKEGRYQEGIDILEGVIPEMQKHYDGLHPILSIAKRQLAMLYKDVKRFEESEDLYLQVLEEHKKLYKPPSRELSITYSEYSVLLDKMGRFEDSVNAADEQMRLLDEIYAGEPSSMYAAAFNNHAYLLKKAGKYQQAIESFEKSIEQQNLIGLAQDHFHRSFPLHGMALTFIEMEKYAEAETIFRRVLPMRLKHMDESHLYVTQVKSSLGDALMRQGKLDEAETYLLDALNFYEQYQGQDSEEANIVRGFLQELAQMRAQNE